MIVFEFGGGLGNQLFMYANGYAVAKRLGAKITLDESFLDQAQYRTPDLLHLNIKYDKLFTTKQKTWLGRMLARRLMHTWWRIRYKYFDSEWYFQSGRSPLEIKDNTYFHLTGGFWVMKYCSQYREDLLAMFTPRADYQMSEGCKEFIARVRSCNSVAVHVRRGDYVKAGICLKDTYYYRCLDKAAELVDDPVYFVFSEDLDYVKRMFKDRPGKYMYVEYKSSNLTLDDFFIMKECKHDIISASSYSFWAAWLNNNPNKTVICPPRKDDLYPSNWTVISTD